MRREAHSGERDRAVAAGAAPGTAPATGVGFTRGDRVPDEL